MLLEFSTKTYTHYRIMISLSIGNVGRFNLFNIVDGNHEGSKTDFNLCLMHCRDENSRGWHRIKRVLFKSYLSLKKKICAPEKLQCGRTGNRTSAFEATTQVLIPLNAVYAKLKF